MTTAELLELLRTANQAIRAAQEPLHLIGSPHQVDGISRVSDEILDLASTVPGAERRANR